MKLDLGQRISILTNLGVIGGVVLLGYELHQNNTLLEAEARQARVGRALEAYNFYGNPEVGPAIAKIQDGEELTSAEELHLQVYALSLFRTWEANYQEVQLGTLDEDAVLSTQRALMQAGVGYPLPWRKYWEAYKFRSSPEFAEWAEQNLIDQ